MIAEHPFFASTGDPYERYRQLRAHDPVHELEPGMWALTRYADCHALLRDPRLSVEPRSMRDYEAELATADERRAATQTLIEQILLFRDPPDHTRLRSLLGQAFGPGVVAGLRERVARLTHALADAVAPAGEMDLMADIAWPLPVIVIAELLGVPHDDRERFGVWARDLARTFEPFRPAQLVCGAERSGAALLGYLGELVAERRARPRTDLISALVGDTSGDGLSELELLCNLVLLLLAGYETTGNLFGNGFLALLRNPDELGRLAGGGAAIEPAVEELLRYDAPVQIVVRIPRVDIDVDGHVLEAGCRVLLILGAANRDPRRFPDPDRLDLARADNRHLSFGGGPHYCLGNALARLEATVAIPILLRRLPGLELVDAEPRFRPGITLRGLETLPLRFRGAGATRR